MAPERLGKYHILGMIAQGGMAEVYMAKTVDIAGFEKVLALKRIKPRFASEARFIRNFIDEARIAVTLNHRNIVQVFDFGKADGELYLAMELLEGVDLRTALQSLGPGERLPASVAAYLLSEVAAGLDYAHRKADSQGVPLGIVHCDVSPHNVLLSREGFVKILDFGVARARFVAAPSSRRLRGKPRYMSPEQTRGDTPSAASDVFVVGILAWELLAGHKLFTGRELRDILKSVRDFRIPDLAGIRPDLPTPLCNAVMRALQRDPEKRGTAREISSVLATAGRELSEGSNAQALSTWLRDNCAPQEPIEQTQTDLAPAPAFPPSATTAVHSVSAPIGEKTQTSLRLALTDSGESDSDLEDHSSSIEQPPQSLASLIDKRRVVITILRLDGGDESRRLQVSRALCDLAYKRGAVVHEHSDQEVVAIFGLELAGEDNIASSMHYALDAAELSRAADSHGHPISLRSAARPGVVAQRRADTYQLRGDALNEARELARGAEPYRPLLSGGAGRVASAQFQFRELAARRYRSRRLRVLELTGPSGHDDRRRALRDRRGRFVGRDEELAQLWHEFQEAALHGRAVGVLVQGDSGIGKSRLIAEFVARLEETGTDTVLIAIAATTQSSAAPLTMAVEHLQAALNLPPGRGENARARLAQSLASCLRQSCSEEEVIEATQSVELAMELRDGALGINEDAAAALRERCAETIALVHRTLAGDRPSVVVLENVHLADEASIGVVRHLLDRKARDMPCIFVLSARHELIGAQELAKATVLRLEELSGPARETLIEDRLGESYDTKGATEVARRTGGNPLYIEELCRTIGEVGWDATPATIRDSVVARIDRLSRRTRAVLQRAAVIGETFRSSILEELVGSAVGPYLQELVEEGLLVQSSQADVQSQGGEFAFRHGLIQEVVYSSLSAAPRRSTHGNLGKLLAFRADSGLDEPPALVALHLELGGEVLASARQWLRAGRVALAAFETASAKNAYTTAIALLGSIDEDDALVAQSLMREALFGRARAYRDLGEPEAQGADLVSLESLCDTDSAEEAELVVHFAERLLRKGVFDGAIERAERAYEIAKNADVPLMQGEALRVMGEGLERTGNFEAGQQRAEEALDIFVSLGVRSFETRARISLARNFLIRARYADAKMMYEPIIAEVQRNRNPGLERIASNHLAVIHMCLGEFEDAMRCAQRSVSLCEADGDQARAGDNLSVCGIILNEVGQFAVAKTYFERALSLHRETKSRWSEADSLIYAGTNAIMLGDIALGLKRLRLAYQYAGEIKSPYVLINAGIGLAEGLLRRDKAGDSEKALDFARTAASQAAAAELAGARAMALSRQALAQHRLGNLEPALELSTQAMEILDTQIYLEGSEEEIVYTHYLLQEATNARDSEETLSRAIAGYERKLDGLTNPSWRESFSDNVATNRALVHLSEQTTE